jgi:AAA+ ATPase superfamily predicted ATPase
MNSFYNREPELQTLLTLIKAFQEGKPNNVALVGIRKVGKTQILFELERRLEKVNNLVSTYVYVEPGAFGHFCDSWLFALLSKTAIALGTLTSDELLRIPEKERMRLLAGKLIGEFPELSKRFFDLVELALSPSFRSRVNFAKGQEKWDAFETLSTCFEFVQHFAQKKGLRYVCMFDEFQYLRTFSESALEDRIRSYLLRQQGYMFITAGSIISTLTDMFENARSPLFGHFRMETVGPFSYEDSRGFILSRLQGRSNLSELQINYLIHLTRGYPYYLDVLVEEILLKYNGLRNISQNAFIDALLSQIFSVNGQIYNYLKYLIEASFTQRGYKSYVDILSAVAQGNKSVTEIANAVKEPKENVNTYLRRLMEMSFLARQNSRYLILDPLLELWLREVFLTEELADRLGLHEKYNLYRSQIERMIQTFKNELGKGNESRIRELFMAFDGSLTFKGLRLPKFSDVRAETVDGAEIDVLAVTDTCVFTQGHKFLDGELRQVSNLGIVKQTLKRFRTFSRFPLVNIPPVNSIDFRSL